MLLTLGARGSCAVLLGGPRVAPCSSSSSSSSGCLASTSRSPCCDGSAHGLARPTCSSAAHARGGGQEAARRRSRLSATTAPQSSGSGSSSSAGLEQTEELDGVEDEGFSLQRVSEQPRTESGRPGGRKQGGKSRRSNESRKVILDERDPMWAPALTEEDLENDPPGHRSGYVAVIGKPNAGKSTLINAIVGQKLSIVSAKPQTTRHRIVGIASADHYQMILFDTPGIIEKKRNKLEERMMSAVVSSIQNAEAIVAVVDSSLDPQSALAMFQPGDNWTGPPMVVLLNKSDLLTPEQLEELKAWYLTACKAEAVFTGSALNNSGVQEVKDWLVTKLPEGPTLYPKSMVSEQPERFFVAELIREKVFMLYSQEVPYSTQVQIKEFKERRNDKDYISAVVLVEKDSQVGIIIGKGGAALKRLGQDARTDIELFLERKVYLELRVEVAKGWRESKQALEQYGYFDSMYT